MKVEKVKKEFEPVVITIENEEEFFCLKRIIGLAMGKMDEAEIKSSRGKFSHDLLTELNK